MKKKLDREWLAKDAWEALRELRLSVVTKADERRLDRIQFGLRALDHEQSEAKLKIEKLQKIPVLTRGQVLEALKAGQSSAKELDEQLKRIFYRG